MREKHYWLVGGWRLLLEWCERKILLAGAEAEQRIGEEPLATTSGTGR